MSSGIGLIAKRLGTIVILISIFLWPALYNKQPFLSPDTSAYVRGFDAAIVTAFGKTSVWTTWAGTSISANADTSNTGSANNSFQSPTFIITGRSVTYGALVYLGELFGGLWATVVLQAAIALFAIGLALMQLALFSWTRFVIATAVLGALSTLPFFTSFLLPDVFAGLSLLAAGILLAPGITITGWQRAFWISILAVSAVFHPTNLANIAVLPAAIVMTYLYNRKISKPGVLALILVTGIGITSELGFALALDKMRGIEVTRPPVILARLIADGPGAAYLRENCPQSGFTACEFIDRLTSYSDSFLRDTSPASGAYSVVSVEKRRALSNEQFKFAIAVLAYDPAGQIIASLRDAFEQLITVGLGDFESAGPQAWSKLPKVYTEQIEKTPMWRKDFPLTLFSSLSILTAIISFLFVAASLLNRRAMISTELKFLCLAVMTGVLSNAFICGALSGPHERYQARMTWLFPLLALLLFWNQKDRYYEARNN